MENKKFVFRGEFILVLAILIDSLGVALMIYSNAGISAISSVPFAFNQVLPSISLGTWTYIFQGALVLLLMLMKHKFVPEYIFSFVVGFVFGVFLDIQEMWIHILPVSKGWCIFYFTISYAMLSIGIALSNRCKLPIVPTDLFPKEMSDITGTAYSKIKSVFDVSCLLTTIVLTGFLLGKIEGIGAGTLIAALTMGKSIGFVGSWIDKRCKFISFLGA